MHASDVFTTVPLGARIAFRDGTPLPPARHTKKLQAWRGQNGEGVLIEKRARPRYITGVGSSETFVLLLSRDENSHACIVVQQIFSLTDTSLDFAVLAPPAPFLLLRGDEVVVQSISREALLAEASRRHGGRPADTVLASGNMHIEVAGYGAARPRPVRYGATRVLDTPDVTVWREYDTDTGLIIERHAPYDIATFPGTVGAALLQRLEASGPDAAATALAALTEHPPLTAGAS